MPAVNQLTCDVCNSISLQDQGYALTTTQVTTSTRYWEYILSKVASPLEKNMLLVTMPETQAKSPTAWFVCESCSSMFDFDRTESREFAIGGSPPPNSGPANLSEVQKAALQGMMAGLRPR